MIDEINASGPLRLSANEWLRKALGLAEDETPFPWQVELLACFANGQLERALDIPTGLGKTAVMPIWLVARACGAKLPRRLVYVVDRRAVVDQATDVAEGLRKFVDDCPEVKQALGLRRSLPISTLRGQHVDNKEWLEDPSSAAIIVGTVDMIGSRLLFEGYAMSRKMRSYHAGLLGVDVLVVLDEAHLVPPFEKLLETIAEGGSVYGPRDDAVRLLVPRFSLLSLSATGRTNARQSFGLGDADLTHPIVRRRLKAPKRTTIVRLEQSTKLHDALAEQAWQLSDNGRSAARIIVFSDKREVATAAREAVRARAEGDKKRGIPRVDVETELFVGGRRVFEREQAATWLKAHGFIAGSTIERTRPTFVFATSAGEVGVDLDADHMVSDLVAWERMVQRLGRVNRRGDGDARVIVLIEPEPKLKKQVEDALKKRTAERSKKESAAIADHEASIARARAFAKPFDQLPQKENVADASVEALRVLRLKAQTDPMLQAVLDDASTTAPLRPALSRALIDAWSMTSLKEHTGRPEIDPWLRGWIDDLPQTSIVWRKYLPVRRRGSDPTPTEVEAFFEAAPPHVSEILETETYHVIAWLRARANQILLNLTSSRQSPKRRAETESVANGDIGPPIHMEDVVAIALTPAGDFSAMLRPKELSTQADPQANRTQKEVLERTLPGTTLIVDARLAGLNDGLLDETTDAMPRTADDGAEWMPPPADNAGTTPLRSIPPIVRFRVRTAEAGAPAVVSRQWFERFRFATERSENDEPIRWLIVEKWRHDPATEDDRSEGREQLLQDHQAWVEDRARTLANGLGLPDSYVDMLGLAGRCHDEGKRARRWQRAFNAKDDRIYAKTLGPVNTALLDHYRHEFGSLPHAESDSGLRALPEDLRDLALHLIATHHGFARPVIAVSGCEDAPPSALEARAEQVALRFARLQKRWGVWGLAWWEALLRAADQQASRDNDATEPTAVEESV